MNKIPKDAYADALLLNVKVLRSGAVIKRDAYADGLLQYVHEEVTAPVLTVDEKVLRNDVTENGKDGKDEDGAALIY